MAVFSMIAFLCDHSIVFAEVPPTFMMTNQYVVNLVVFDCISGNLPSECTFCMGAYVLGTDQYLFVNHGSTKRQVQKARQNHQI